MESPDNIKQADINTNCIQTIQENQSECVHSSNEEYETNTTQSPTTLSNENKTETKPHTNSNALIKGPTDTELDTQEIDKLFEILFESDSHTFGDIFSHERVTFKPMRRFAPYPVHQQLFMQQQQEQERRRQSLTVSSYSRTATTSRDYLDTFRSCETGLPYSVVFRAKTVKKIIAFIDKYSTRTLSNENDCSEKCVICMNSYQINQILRNLVCNHKFHRKCIDEWLVKSYLCPVCRKDLTGTGKIFKGMAILYHIWKQEKCSNNETLTNPDVNIRQNVSSQNPLSYDSE